MATVADVMTKEVITITPETPIRELAELLYTRRISGVPVVDEGGTLLGVVSEGDLIMHADTVGEQRRSWWLGFLPTIRRSHATMHGRMVAWRAT